MPYKKGESGNLAGRPKGAKDKISEEVKALARSVLEQPKYLQRIKSQAIEGTLHPKIESMLWAYAYGQPTGTNEQGNTGITVNLGFISTNEPQQLQAPQVLLNASKVETEH